MYKVVIVGSSGQLGQSLLSTKEWGEALVDAVSGKSEGNIKDPDFRESLSEYDVVVNCSAVHDVDKIEDSPLMAKEAFLVNGYCVGALAKTLPNSTLLVHISTDYVYGNGNVGNIPLGTRPKPLNVYGATKLVGEELIRANRRNYQIIRTQALYGHAKPKGKDYNFPDLVVDKLLNGEEMEVVANERTSPTYTDHLATTIWDLVDEGRTGTFQLSSQGCVSWYEFAVYISNLLGVSDELLSPRFEPFGTAPRPDKSCMRGYPVELPNWKVAIEQYLQKEGVIDG